MARKRMEKRTVKSDTAMMLGAPAVPMPADRSRALAKLVASLPNVLEAHIPQCFVVGEMDAPAQVLFICFRTPPSEVALEMLGRGLKSIVPQGEHLDIWPLTPESSTLPGVRGAGCQIYAKPKRRWWWPFR